MEVNGNSIMSTIAISTSQPFYFLDLAVEAFPQSIGNAMLGVGNNVVQMIFNRTCSILDRLQTTANRPTVPIFEEMMHPTRCLVAPEISKVFFDGMSTANLFAEDFLVEMHFLSILKLFRLDSGSWFSNIQKVLLEMETIFYKHIDVT